MFFIINTNGSERKLDYFPIKSYYKNMKKVAILGCENILGYGVLETFLKTQSNNYELKIFNNLQDGQKIINHLGDRANSSIKNFSPWSISTLQSLCVPNSKDNPDYIINCLDYESENPRLNSYINGYFPHALSEWAQKCNVKLIHFSSIKALDISKKIDHTENHETFSNEKYGLSKKIGEPNECMTLRINTPIGICPREKEGLLTLIKSQASTAGKLTPSSRHILNSITNLEAGKVCKTIIDKSLYQKSLVHVFSPTPLPYFQVVKLLCKKYNLNVEVEPDNQGEVKREILKSSNDIYQKLNIKPLQEQIENL